MEWEKRKVAADAEMDVADLQQLPGFEVAQRNEDFDAPLFYLPRRVLQDFVDAERNRRLIKGIPRTAVAVIPAYDGPQAFFKDTQVAGLDFEDRPKIQIENHWPHGAAPLFL